MSWRKKDAGGWQSPRFPNERSRGGGRLCSIPVFLSPFIVNLVNGVSRNTTKGPGITGITLCQSPEYKGCFFDPEVRPNNSGF